MKILSIGIDASVAQRDSQAAARQRAYFGAGGADIVVLSTGESRAVEIGEGVVVHVAGGASKAAAFVKGLRLIRQLCAKNQYDAITSQDALFVGVLGRIASRKAHAPFMVQLHGDYLDNPLWINQRLLNRILNPIGKWVVRHADAVRCVSGRLRQQVIGQFHVAEDRVVSLPICPDLSVYSATGPRHENGPTVLFVGRLIDEKSPLLFCKVATELMRRFSELRTVIAGQGNLESKMRQVFEEAGMLSRVQFVGQLPPEELAMWYRSSRCLIHTAAWEGWGIPMIESMACGCPVVTTDSGCANEAVRNGENGVVVAVDDREGLISGAAQLIEDAEERDRLSRAAIAEATNWSFASSVKKQAAFFEHMIQRYHHEHHD